MTYDYIFVGAGPSGLTGAISAARRGKKCLIIEKKSSLEQHPRGETLRLRPILDDILGEGVMESLAVAKTALIEYFAPEPEKVERIAFTMHADNVSFHWDAFMKAFQKQIDSLGIDLLMSTEVIDVVNDGDCVVGVVYRDADGREVTEKADVVFASDGHQSIVGRKAGVDYQSMYFPIIKGMYKNATFDTPGFKFFLIPAGSMTFAPDFPPAVAFLFPRDENNCESAVLVMANSAEKLGYEIPSQQELMRVWKLMIRQYPFFSDMLKDATEEICEASMIPMTGPLSDFIPRKGVVLLGDAAGFIEVSGGSGLVSSMESARFWVDMIVEEQNRTRDSEGIWQEQTVQNMTEAFILSPIYRHIKANADRNVAGFETLFVELRTSEQIIRNWELVKAALDVY